MQKEKEVQKNERNNEIHFGRYKNYKITLNLIFIAFRNVDLIHICFLMKVNLPNLQQIRKIVHENTWYWMYTYFHKRYSRVLFFFIALDSKVTLNSYVHKIVRIAGIIRIACPFRGNTVCMPDPNIYCMYWEGQITSGTNQAFNLIYITDYAVECDIRPNVRYIGFIHWPLGALEPYAQ